VAANFELGQKTEQIAKCEAPLFVSLTIYYDHGPGRAGVTNSIASPSGPLSHGRQSRLRLFCQRQRIHDKQWGFYTRSTVCVKSADSILSPVLSWGSEDNENWR
jgi:hypothetical protein